MPTGAGKREVLSASLLLLTLDNERVRGTVALLGGRSLCKSRINSHLSVQDLSPGEMNKW